MLHDIFAACELYARLYQKVRSPQIAGIDYAAMSHSVRTANSVKAAAPDATTFRYLDLFWQLEACMGLVLEDIGEPDYIRWATRRLLSAETEEDGWALWLTIPSIDRPSRLGSRGAFRDGWESAVRAGDLALDYALQQGRLLA